MRLGPGLALLLVAAPAAAETPPSAWERARDPEAAVAYDVHEQVQRRLALLMADEESIPRGSDRERDLRAVLPILQHAQAETGKSALLRFDLGFVYMALKNYPRAAEIYRGAVRDFPDHPGTEQGWLRLALACGHLGDNACERAAYTRVLELQTEGFARITPSLNLAETQMHLGNLREAVEGYREVVRLSGHYPARETGPLALWGLAVALDRSGDRVEAERAAKLAADVEHLSGKSKLLHDVETAFFEPAWEISWYDAIGFVVQAKAAPTARDAARLWAEAEKSYGDFVKRGTPANDRWAPIAKARLAQVQLERKRAEERAAREPAPRRTEAGDVTL